ncbi:tail-completion protein [Vibrio phage 1.083.O._10N.286.52.B9]|nr:tail-completion protein [Vibrio phage 1.083.O._10N.286.52.B9]
MTKIYNEVLTQVVDKLKAVTKANGYTCDLTVLNGWLTFYAKDLADGKNGLAFPAVSVHYDTDGFNKNKNTTDVKISRKLKITGAVSTESPELVNAALDDLLHDVACAIGGNGKLTIDDADYMLPKGNDPYAMFDMGLTITINDKWEINK